MSIIIRRMAGGVNPTMNKRFTIGADYRVIRDTENRYVIADDQGKEALVNKNVVGSGRRWEHIRHEIAQSETNIQTKPTNVTPENQMKTQTTVIATTIVNGTDVRQLTSENLLASIKSEKEALADFLETITGIKITVEHQKTITSAYEGNIIALTALFNDKLTEEA